MIFVITTGLGLTILTIAIHAAGTALLVNRFRLNRRDQDAEIAYPRIVGMLSGAAILLLVLHLTEVCVWAVVYRILPDVEAIATLEDAIYFSGVTFAALGYGDITLVGHWRMLSAIQAATGLLIFGWSTAILIAIVQSIWRPVSRG